LLNSYCYIPFQETADNGKPFPEVLKLYNEWYEKEVGTEKSLVVTCGDWDLKTMLPSQCRLDKLKLPPHCFQWHNIKEVSTSMMNWAEISENKLFSLLKPGSFILIHSYV